MWPPGPRGAFFLGSFAGIRRDPLAFVTRMAAEYGDIVSVRLGPLRVVLLSHPDDIESVLVTHHDRFIKGRTLGGARRLFGNGLLTSDGALHARQRRFVQPAFHRVRMDGYGAVMKTAADERSRGWRDGDVVDIAAEMSRLTLTISTRVFFGGDGDAIAAAIARPLDIASDALDVVMLPFAAVTERLPLPGSGRVRAARTTLERVIREVIARRRREPRDRGDVLSLMLEMPDEQLCDELITLLLASHETTANALAWTWYLLARHADPEARVQAEADAAGELPFTRMVFAESMRLYPPAWLIARETIAAHEARGYAIPPGAIVVMSPWVVHRDAQYFPSPGQFDPDRWSAEPQNGRPRFAYFPFGGGARGCMGEAFAWMEGVTVVAAIARHWQLRCVDPAEPAMHPGLTLKPKFGIRMQLARRSA